MAPPSPAAAFTPLRPIYTLAGDESFFLDRFRAALITHVDPAARDFSLFDEDLATTPLDDILDRARNPSLMAPLQIFFVRNVKELFGRGRTAGLADDSPAPAKITASKKKHGDFPDNLGRYAKRAGHESPPPAVVVFVADHLHLPADLRRMSLDDKGKLQRIEATLGAAGPVLHCGRVPEPQAVALTREMAADLRAELAPDAARFLVELLDGNLGLLRQEVAKLAAHAPVISRADIESLVSASQLGSVFELAVHLAKRERGPSLASLRRIWSEEGYAQAVPLIFMLSRAMKMALLAKQARATDTRDLYSSLPDGLRPPSFAAEPILSVSRNMPEPRIRQAIKLLHQADVDLRSTPLSVPLVLEQIVFALT